MKKLEACDLEPTSSEYLFGENMNESLKLPKENYKLSQNLVSTKSRNKVADLYQGQGFNQDQITKLKRVFLLKTRSL